LQYFSRRWINGTVAAFLYVFSSKRAQSRVQGGFFDSHKAGKSLRFVNALWGLSLLQFFFVLVSPTVFGVALYNGLIASAKYTTYFDWIRTRLFEDVRLSIVYVCLYLLVYIAWTINAFFVKVFLNFFFLDLNQGGRIPEWQCWIIVLVSFLAVLPVYFGVVISAVVNFTTVHWLIICSLIGPVLIAITQSLTSALLYVLYLPYFLALVVFFLVFTPSYSFARLWDTTWGNRQTGRDESLDVKKEETIKSHVFSFIVGLIYFNVVATLTLCISLTDSGQLIFMGILLFPTMIQIIGSIIYLVIVVPCKALTSRDYSSLSD
jgi:hypothetical protein